MLLRTLLAFTTVAVVSVALVACTRDGDEDATAEPIVPTAVLTLTASPAPTEAPPNPQGEPRRTGDPALDVIIEAVEARDIEALVPLVQYTTVGCTTADGLGGPPKCEEDVAEGTEFTMFPVSSCEGGWTRYGVQSVADFAHRTVGLWGVVHVDRYWEVTDGWPAPDTFLAFHTTTPSGDSVAYLEVADGHIVRASFGCGGTIDDLLAVSSMQLSLAAGPWDEPTEALEVTPPTTGIEAVDGILAAVDAYDWVTLRQSALDAIEDLPPVACVVDPIGPGSLPCGPKDSPDDPISVFPLAYCEGSLVRDPGDAIASILNEVPTLYAVVEAPAEASQSDLYRHGAYWIVYELLGADTDGLTPAVRLHVTAEGNLTTIWFGCLPPIEELVQWEGEPLPEVPVR